MTKGGRNSRSAGVECDPANKDRGMAEVRSSGRRTLGAKPEQALVLADHGASLRLVEAV